MYELTDLEIDAMVSQNVIPDRKYLGGATPFAFTDNRSKHHYNAYVHLATKNAPS